MGTVTSQTKIALEISTSLHLFFRRQVSHLAAFTASSTVLQSCNTKFKRGTSYEVKRCSKAKADII